MRSAAQFVAQTLQIETIQAIRQITSGRELEIFDENMRYVPHPELPAIAQLLPTNAACQIAQIAVRTGSAADEVVAEVANVVSKDRDRPKRATASAPRADACRDIPVLKTAPPGSLAGESFPALDKPVDFHDRGGHVLQTRLSSVNPRGHAPSGVERDGTASRSTAKP
jgi:hypothetical protein